MSDLQCVTVEFANVNNRTRFEADYQHPDDIAVDAFAVVMKAKLAASRAKGRGGWNDPAQCSAAHLSDLLREHVGKDDPVDVANFAMMLHQRGAVIAKEPCFKDV